MKTKAILLLLDIIYNSMVNMLAIYHNNPELREVEFDVLIKSDLVRYNRASGILDKIILECFQKGINPQTSEIDCLPLEKQDHFYISYNKYVHILSRSTLYY